MQLKLNEITQLEANNERLEQCPVCGGRMIEGKYICALCEDRDNSSKKTPPLMTDEPEYTPEFGGCKRCNLWRQDDCRERVRNNRWTACEIPDLLDYTIAGISNPDEAKKYFGKDGSTRWNSIKSALVEYA